MTDPVNGRPSWRDVNESVNSLRSEMQAGFFRVEDRVARVEQQVATSRGSRTEARWGIPVTIQIATAFISLCSLIIAVVAIAHVL